jgi:Lon protease-like protein
MFPLGMVIFPHQTAGLCVFEPRYRQLLVDSEESSEFGTCLIARGSEVGGGDERTSVGTMLRVLGTQELDGQILVMVEGISCLTIGAWLPDAPYPRALAQERSGDDAGVDLALLKSTESAVRALRALQSEVIADQCLQNNCEMDADPWIRSWQLCALTPMSVLDQFKVLGLSSVNERLRLVAEICCERYGDYQRMLELDARS